MYKITYLNLIFFALSFSVLGQNENKKSQFLKEKKPIVYAEKHILQSEILGGEEQVKIYLPESFHEASEDHVYPIIVTLEDEFFHLTTGIVKHLGSVNRMPEAIVVSIIGGPVVPKVYTNGSDNWPADWKQLPFGSNPDKFSKYLEKELFPYLEKNYRAAKYRIVIGYSGTSLYTFHSLIKEPDLFQAHIAIASGDILGMGYQDGISFIDELENRLIKEPNLKINLYVASADQDTKEGPVTKSNLLDLPKRINSDKYQNLKLISKIFPNEGHYHIALPALADAMNMIFPVGQWFPEYPELMSKPGNALDNIDAFYNKLSDEYGFRILPRAERWNNQNCLRLAGRQLIQKKRFQEAIQVLKRRTEYRPKSSAAFQSLAKAYEANNQIKIAIETQKKAMQLAELANINTTPYQEYLNKLSNTSK